MAVKFQGGRAVPTSNASAEVKQTLRASFRQIKDFQILLMRLHGAVQRSPEKIGPPGLLNDIEAVDNAVERLALRINAIQ